MTWSFDRFGTLIVVSSRVFGPVGSAFARLALDTGASRTVLDPELLRIVGIDTDRPEGTIPVKAIGATIETPLFQLPSLTALGQTRTDLRVLGHQVTLTQDVDGLLGLDFFRDPRLMIDFQAGTLELE